MPTPSIGHFRNYFTFGRAQHAFPTGQRERQPRPAAPPAICWRLVAAVSARDSSPPPRPEPEVHLRAAASLRPRRRRRAAAATRQQSARAPSSPAPRHAPDLPLRPQSGGISAPDVTSMLWKRRMCSRSESLRE